MTQRIRIRRDIAANWTSVNPTLMLGEIGYETDTTKIKVGDGTTAWASLQYIMGSISVVEDSINSGTTDKAPSEHAVYNALASKINASELGQPLGVATLGSDGLLSPSQIPSIAISDTYVVSSQAAMLALAATMGDVAVRTDINETFILSATDPTMLANWVELLSPASPVQSVNGYTGNVVLAKSDVGLGNVTNDLQLKASNLTTDGTLSGDSDTLIPSEKAVKTYADNLSIDGGGA